MSRKAMVMVTGLMVLSGLFAGFGMTSAREPKAAGSQKADVPQSRVNKETPEKAVGRLVEQLKLHPARPSAADRRYALYLIDVATGEVIRVADQPDPGLTYCGSAAWSYDGGRILFDATPWTEWTLSRLKSIEVDAGRLTFRDLGLGNSPTFSPAGDRIAFLLNSGAEPGVWMMNADGSERRPLGDYGRPRWSPDSRQFMIASFSNPCQVTLMGVRPEKSGPLQVPGQNIFSVPSWEGAGTIVAVIGTDVGDTIALLDVTDPSQGKIKQVLWKRTNGPDIKPYFPLYSASTRRCIFVGGEPEGMALYSFRVGKAEPPRRLEPEGHDKELIDLAMSPDGRYVLFSSDRPDRRPNPPAPSGGNTPARK